MRLRRAHPWAGSLCRRERHRPAHGDHQDPRHAHPGGPPGDEPEPPGVQVPSGQVTLLEQGLGQADDHGGHRLDLQAAAVQPQDQTYGPRGLHARALRRPPRPGRADLRLQAHAGDPLLVLQRGDGPYVGGHAEEAHPRLGDPRVGRRLEAAGRRPRAATPLGGRLAGGAGQGVCCTQERRAEDQPAARLALAGDNLLTGPCSLRCALLGPMGKLIYDA
mmetsp:Transcript_68871/g.183181  ORF Transcript_68871/g.183181 Transcript_68871/m.183181 type:complete len:219 (+) Transcript_68871:702-1358(+)